MSGATWQGSPAASVASARRTVISQAMRRDRKPVFGAPDPAHTPVSGPASRSAPTTSSPVSASHRSRATASPRSCGPAPSGPCSDGMLSRARVRTRASTQRRALPRMGTRSSSDQSGQVGTVADRSAPEVTTALDCPTRWAISSQ
ncbi:hypothetical protein [Streptomyces sp. NPDC046870]|uniref:hypothetical protein n=1 Tax=Streptomyces sp. NPDC046870 TaxID=3155135 RepID=UPI00345326F8